MIDVIKEPFDLDAYLDRIGLRHVNNDIDGLRTLQAAHMSHIPFENIDPLLGIVPSLDPVKLQEKIIQQRRGGYCFELNALFGMALKKLGFRSTTLLARVRNGAREGGARSHQLFVVNEAGQDWLADVGFGGHGAICPIPLDDAGSYTVANGEYRTRFDSPLGETVIERAQSGDWHGLFSFERSRVHPIDLEASNHLTATWRSFPFSTHLIMALHSDSGRTTLFNRKFKKAGQAPRIVGSTDELGRVLADSFGVTIGDISCATLWDKIQNAPLNR